MVDVIELSKSLIACPSVTPRDEGAQDILASALEALGFTTYRLPFGEGEDRVPNLFARLGTAGPHICFAGHTDVVPPGPEEAWTYGAFNPTIAEGILYGRGASDMKGSVAAYVASISQYLETNGTPAGSISLLITGDEEADAINGTVKVLEWMAENDHTPDVCLVGEPTNPDTLGQEIKIGRRGSLSAILTVSGTQGHVAYPHRADNPMPRLVAMLAALSAYNFDTGTEFFAPTNLEITTIDVGNTADNVIPESGTAWFNIRFNDQWTGETLENTVREILNQVSSDYTLKVRRGAESFMTPPGAWTNTVRQAVQDVTGKTPEFTTTGGTSDARFTQIYCPTVEFGPINSSIHQINEHAAVDDLIKLTDIYTRLLTLYFAQDSE